MNTQQILKSFGGRIVGSEETKQIIAQTVPKLPLDLQERVTKNVWFLSTPPDAWAYTFKGSDIPKKHLIFLSDELLEQPLEDIQFTILHEIGHVVLNHSNSINYRQTHQEIKKQEQEADQFAYQYLYL